MKKLIAVLAVSFFLQACSVDFGGGAGAGGEASILGYKVAGIGGEIGAGINVGATPVFTH